MRRLLAVLLAGLAVLVAPVQAQAAAPRVFRNCTAMHQVYKGGVARKGAKDHRKSGHAKYKPHVSNALYRANSRLDRDRDGIACEQ